MRHGKQWSGIVARRGSAAECGGGDKTWEVEVGVRDCACVVGESVTCSVQDCEDVFRFGNNGAVDGDDGAEVQKDVMGVTEEKVQETGVRDGLEEGGGGELGELRFGIAKDV